MTDMPLVKRVLQEVIAAADRLSGIEHDGKPIYQIDHVALEQIAARFGKESGQHDR